MTCTFFGHRIVPNAISTTLKSVIIDLIKCKNVKTFYVGNHGEFDFMVSRILRELADEFDISFYIVLAYMPLKTDDNNDYSYTILPDGIERVPKRFAIDYRNKWMLKRADFVVTYITEKIVSRSAQFKDYAMRQNKTVIEISEINSHK